MQPDWEPRHIIAPTEYPLLARQANIQGTTELRCTISADGNVTTCEPVSSHVLLYSAAADNVKLWTFRRVRDSADGNNKVLLVYAFELAGQTVRGQPKVQFSFDYPNVVHFTAEPGCVDHLPCTPAEVEQWKQQNKKRMKQSVP
jgi:hypothetical protein